MRGVLYLVPLGLIGAGLLFVPAGSARAQGKGAPVDEIHLGAGSCAAQACHGGAVAERKEYKVWATEDKHHKAYDVLLGSLGQRIGTRLGIDPTREESCLGCHATTGVRLAKTHVVEDGVSCELCHGGAKEWLGPHATPEWQTLTVEQKARRGLRDLSKPETRAAVCIRCHVGEQGSDITHDIMAAGHPPLVFDAAAFLRAMPPHWKDEEDISLATWLAGLKASALGQLGRIERASEKRGLEFAVFDCFSCHHAIYSGSVYEQRPAPGKAGDIPLDLSALKVLTIADPRIKIPAELTFSPRKGDNEKLLATVRDLKGRVEAVPILPGDKQRYLDNLKDYLGEVAAGKAYSPLAEMHLLVMALRTLGGAEIGAELDRALKWGTSYDQKRCAQLALESVR